MQLVILFYLARFCFVVMVNVMPNYQHVAKKKVFYNGVGQRYFEIRMIRVCCSNRIHLKPDSYCL